MSRRLPVYLLIDTSGSMQGEAIESVRSGLLELEAALKQDPRALETVYLSTITFNSVANQATPLTLIEDFVQPTIVAGGSTSMGAALTLLNQCIDREVNTSSSSSKGDWRPIVFIFTDGQPTDNINEGIENFKKSKIGLCVACAAGPNADTTMLKKVTENVVSLANTDRNSIKAFFQWVSASIAVSSKKVEQTNHEATGLSDLPPPPDEINTIF